MSPANTPPNLEDRFLEPDGWRWHRFRTGGYEIRFGALYPEEEAPKAIVVILPGLGEFCEKYFELVRDLHKNGFATWIIDWPDQGMSDHYLPDENKRHSFGFQREINALHDFYFEYIKHASVHPKVGRIPLVMLAHSMGANIGLRYLYQHPDTFEAAFFSAPMFGIKTFKNIPHFLAKELTGFGCLFWRFSYAPGQGPWKPRKPISSAGHDGFSSDPVRSTIYNKWCEAEPKLRIGGVTWRWLHEAVVSCATLQSSRLLSAVKTPFCVAIAERDKLVDNAAAHRVVKRALHARSITLKGAQHEILMERDEIRNQALNVFYEFVNETVCNKQENLKTELEKDKLQG